MAIDFNNPIKTQNYDTGVLSSLRAHQIALAKLLEGETVSNPVTGLKRINNGLFEEFNGSSWAKKALKYLDSDSAGAIDVSSTSAALRVTQRGTGAAILVEDTTNPDATPFSVDADGRVLIGATSSYSGASGPAALQTTGLVGQSSRYIADDANPPVAEFQKHRASGGGIVSNLDSLGRIQFAGYDGTAPLRGAQIFAQVDGSPGTGSMPGALIFSTTPSGSGTPVERMRITSTGGVLLGGSGTAGHWLAIAKSGGPNSGVEAVGVYSAVSGSASSTSAVQGYRTALGVDSGATTAAITHYYAVQGTLSGTATDQYGFRVFNNLTGATNNYGFHSGLAAAANRWNFYAAGTADNAFAGDCAFGGLFDPSTPVDVLANAAGFSVRIRGRASDNLSLLTFYNNTATTEMARIRAETSSDALIVSTGSATTERLRINSTGVIAVKRLYTASGSEIAFTATPSFDASSGQLIKFGALTANVTSMTLTNAAEGHFLSIRFKQDATGGRTVAVPAGAKVSGSVGVLANQVSYLNLTYNTADARWEGAWTVLPV